MPSGRPMNRTKYVMKNVFLGYASTMVLYILQFISRTALVRIMGAEYLGVNGLFTNVLGVLSFAELGIGTALNFSLYRPVAEGNKEKIKSLMALYKSAYRIIAGVIAAGGVVLIPFLHYLVKDPGNVGDVRVYYCVFLFNTVTSYFVSYKYSLANAMQENYVDTVMNMFTKGVSTIAQLVALFLAQDYMLFLLAGAVVDFVQKIWVSVYLNRRYPLLKEKDVQKLTQQDKKQIIGNVRALIWHQVGNAAVHQTDNIIISAFLNVSTAGRVTYYTLFVDAANHMFSVAFNAVVGSLGNAVSTEGREKQYELFKAYRFLAFWLYGFAAIGLYVLLLPLVELFAGKDIILPQLVLFLIIFNFYMLGQRIAVNNMKVAGGIFKQDQFIALLQAVVNIITSIFFVKLIGLPGVYIGTLIQGTIATVIKPIILYREMFHRSALEYFLNGIRYLAVVVLAGAVCISLHDFLITQTTFLTFILEIVAITFFVNAVFYFVFRKTAEFQYLWKTFGVKIIGAFHIIKNKSLVKIRRY